MRLAQDILIGSVVIIKPAALRQYCRRVKYQGLPTWRLQQAKKVMVSSDRCELLDGNSPGEKWLKKRPLIFETTRFT